MKRKFEVIDNNALFPYDNINMKCSFKLCIKDVIKNSFFCSKHDDLSTIQIRKTIFFSKKSNLILPIDIIINIILEILPISKLDLNSFYDKNIYIKNKLNEADKLKILRFIYFMSSISKEIANNLKIIIDECYLFLYLNDIISRTIDFHNSKRDMIDIFNKYNINEKKDFFNNNIEKIKEFYILYKKKFQIHLNMADINKKIIHNGIEILINKKNNIQELNDEDKSESTMSSSDDV